MCGRVAVMRLFFVVIMRGIQEKFSINGMLIQKYGLKFDNVQIVDNGL